MYCSCVLSVFVFNLKVRAPVSLISCSLSFFFLLFLQCQLRFVALSYHYLMVQGKHSVSINFVLIILFIPCLNSSTNTLSSKLLPLTAFLNSCTNSSIMILLYSTKPLTNSIFKSAKKSHTDIYLIFPLARSFITFSFRYLSAYMIILIVFVLLLILYLSSSKYTAYRLLEIQILCLSLY